MERSRSMENMEIGNGTVPKNEKYGSGFSHSRIPYFSLFGTLPFPNPIFFIVRDPPIPESHFFQDLRIPVSHFFIVRDRSNPDFHKSGMERSRKMKKMGYGNGRVPNNGKNGIREWEDPGQ